MPCLFEDKDRPPPCQGVFRRRVFRVGPSVLSRHLPTLDGSTTRLSSPKSERFDQGFDGELSRTAHRPELVEGLAEVR